MRTQQWRDGDVESMQLSYVFRRTVSKVNRVARTVHVIESY